MTTKSEPTLRKPLRLWPGIAAAVLLVLVRFVVPTLVPGRFVVAIIGGVVGSLAVVVWWLFFSRAPWSERLGAIVLSIGAVAVTKSFVHESIRGGMMGMMLPLYAMPVLAIVLVIWAVASRRFSAGMRRATMVTAIVLACGLFTLLRTDGVTGDDGSQLGWRWTPTAEERLLAHPLDVPESPAARLPFDSPESPPPQSGGAHSPARPAAEVAKAVQPGAEPAVPAAAAAAARAAPPLPAAVETPAAWPGFRGPARDGVVRGVRINTAWSASPPVQIWRRPIGPGWSSFAVHGDLIYTQEQRGEHEMVSCYRLSTGEPVWLHRDPVRFYESNGGAGPRGTPTVHAGRVYALGATGIVKALNAATGAVVWSRDGAADSGAELPGWGFASSPVIVDDLVIVALSGRLVAYDLSSGDPRWLGPTGGAGYSSPHLVTIGGVPQVVLLRGSRTISVAPADGTLLWDHSWQPGASIVQPALTVDGDLLIPTADAMGGQGMRRLAVRRASTGWEVEERWTSRGLKPYFNDFVVHKGHAYGFDGSILAAIDLRDGERRWKGGRYGHGQLVLLAEQDLLLVVSEEGELAIVSATPEQFREVARFKALEGKSWNHPVLVGDLLLVRNGEEMAAFQLPLSTRGGS